MILRKSNTSVLFTGDYDYTQVCNYMLPDVRYKCNQFLIVPHHGGNAGKFAYACSTQNILKDAVISVGPNPYKPSHPHTNNIAALVAKGFSVIRTDIIAHDYVISV